MTRSGLLRYRLGLLMSLGAIVPLGFWVRFHGVFPEWINDALGAIAYEIFWVLLGVLLWPRVPIWQIAVGVCVATGALEFLQLYQPDWLQAIRRTLPGRLVLGNQFSWMDFPSYVVGSGAGWVWGRCLQLRFSRDKSAS
jgi:Protein of unknown function (DUF2809)